MAFKSLWPVLAEKLLSVTLPEFKVMSALSICIGFGAASGLTTKFVTEIVPLLLMRS